MTQVPEKNSGTILLVDDEQLILDVTREMLKHLGFDVMTAENGMQAVDLLGDEGVSCDLIILDLMMPGMDGSTTFQRLRELRPALPVLLSSGYAVNEQANEVMDQGCEGFIQKPFNMKQLSQKVREILENQ